MTPLKLLDVTRHEVVLIKPPGLASELPRNPQADSLVTRLRLQGFADLRLVHRLDSPACGVMIVARSAEAAAHYSAEIAARRWRKVYVAEVAASAEWMQALIGPHKAYLSTEGRRARLVRSGGKPSFLTIVAAAPVPDAPARSHVVVHLQTGRFHQIRVMLAGLGAPIAGDTLYGGPEGSMYLEHVLLAARVFDQTQPRVWRAPAHDGRRPWAPELTAAVDSQEADALNEA